MTNLTRGGMKCCELTIFLIKNLNFTIVFNKRKLIMKSNKLEKLYSRVDEGPD
jgi:hypothetical protein